MNVLDIPSSGVQVSIVDDSAMVTVRAAALRSPLARVVLLAKLQEVEVECVNRARDGQLKGIFVLLESSGEDIRLAAVQSSDWSLIEQAVAALAAIPVPTLGLLTYRYTSLELWLLQKCDLTAAMRGFGPESQSDLPQPYLLQDQRGLADLCSAILKSAASGMPQALLDTKLQLQQTWKAWQSPEDSYAAGIHLDPVRAPWAILAADQALPGGETRSSVQLELPERQFPPTRAGFEHTIPRCSFTRNLQKESVRCGTWWETPSSPTAAPTATAANGLLAGQELDGEEALRPTDTTLMLSYVPCRMRQDELAVLIDGLGFLGRWDYLYLPSGGRAGKKRSNNMGYAFVNFTQPAYARESARLLHGYQFAGCNPTRRPCRVRRACFQGMAALTAHFRRCPAQDCPEIRAQGRPSHFLSL